MTVSIASPAETHRRVVTVLLGAFAFVAAGALLYVLTIGANDFADYRALGYRLQGARFRTALLTERYEVASLFVLWSLAQALSPTAMIYSVGLAAFSIKSYLIHRHLHPAWVAWLVYITLFMYIPDATQIRAALGACFVLYALLTQRGPIYCAAIAVVGALFHFSALIILSLCVVAWPLAGLAAVAVMAALWNALVAAYPIAVGLRYLSGTVGGVNLTNSNFIMQVCLCAIAAYEWPRLTVTQRKGAYLLMIGAVSYVVFQDNPIFAHRFRELSVLGILPLIFSGERRFSDAKLLMLACVGYLSAYTIWFVLAKYASL